ncbi:MAG: IS1595 family transposase, partial [Bdellovibrionales bacterium]|nr:IS1595 family transposase [Bdellovibrionales bacterium]MCY4512972.1 IS1595 family transposase [Bdellovibrionales bacterium]
KFRGMNKETFYLHLKECEFRFNYREDDLYKLLLKMIRNKPLKSS